MVTRILSPRPFAIACLALASLSSSPAKAATITAWFDQTQTVGDAFTVRADFSWGSTPFYFVQQYEAVVTFDPLILRPQGVRFSSELGSPDVIAYAFDPVQRYFIPDLFGAGDALTIADRAGYLLDLPDSVETIRVNAYSLVFEELFQPGYMTLFEVAFDTLAPGVSPLDMYYRLNNGPAFSQALCTQVGVLQNCSVNVQPVPEPSTVLMMLVGVPWLLARRRSSPGQ